MNDTSESRASFPSEPRQSAYRAILLAKDGAIVGAVRFSAQSDALAVERAKSIVDGHAVELWHGLRFIAHFPPVE